LGLISRFNGDSQREKERENPFSQQIFILDCPIEKVIVYSDRAEVGRRVTLDAESAGQYEITVTNLCSLVMKDNVRVSESPSNVTIFEVSYDEKYENEVVTQSAAVAELEAKTKQLKQLIINEKQLQDRHARLKKEEAWLKKYSEDYIDFGNQNRLSLEEVAKTLGFCHSELEKLETARLNLEKQLKELREQISLLTTELERKKAPVDKTKEKLRPQIIVSFFVHTKGKVRVFNFLISFEHC
jgi:hypothetical protein